MISVSSEAVLICSVALHVRDIRIGRKLPLCKSCEGVVEIGVTMGKFILSLVSEMSSDYYNIFIESNIES